MNEGEFKVGRNFAPTIRPLARPEQFLLAPMMCGVLTDMSTMLIALIMITKFNWPGMVLLTPLLTHCALILVGLREPQIDNLLRAKMATKCAPGPSRTQHDGRLGSGAHLRPELGLRFRCLAGLFEYLHRGLVHQQVEPFDEFVAQQVA